MALRTRLTRFFEIEHPIVLAPMTPVSGGALAGAVSAAGGLGLIGGGYGDKAWLEAEFDKSANQRVGCGFITWSMARQPELLDLALSHRPAAMMLSFGDPAPFVETIRAAGVPLIVQAQTLEHVRRALDVGAEIVVAQGTEAGGHGMATRGTMAFVPAVADLLGRRSPETLLLAAGGIADGRGLAAALSLGADGVLVGTRFWATKEALIPAAAKARALQASGDDTLRTSVFDILRGLDWPAPYTLRLMRNAFAERWHGREGELRKTLEAARADHAAAVDAADYENAVVTVGEAIGLIDSVQVAAEIVASMVAQAEERIVALQRAAAPR